MRYRNVDISVYRNENNVGFQQAKTAILSWFTEGQYKHLSEEQYQFFLKIKS